MKFIQLFGFIAVLVPHCLAASAGSNNLRDSDLIYNEQRAPSQSEASDNDISGQILAGSCKNNNEKITEDVGKCDIGSSKGILSAHNCKNKGGKYYYCVTTAGQTGECTKIKNAIGLEHGECFL